MYRYSLTSQLYQKKKKWISRYVGSKDIILLIRSYRAFQKTIICNFIVQCSLRKIKLSRLVICIKGFRVFICVSLFAANVSLCYWYLQTSCGGLIWTLCWRRGNDQWCSASCPPPSTWPCCPRRCHRTPPPSPPPRSRTVCPSLSASPARTSP